MIALAGAVKTENLKKKIVDLYFLFIHYAGNITVIGEIWSRISACILDISLGFALIKKKIIFELSSCL